MGSVDHSRIHEDLLTFSLTVKLRVAQDSYLYIGSASPTIKFRNTPDWNRVNRLVSQERFNELVQESLRLLSMAQASESVAEAPVIVGSSLKGSVRSRLELLVNSRKWSEKLGLIPCFSVSVEFLPPSLRPGMHGYRHSKIWPEAPWRDRRRGPCGNCLLCNMFGYTTKRGAFKSRVWFGTFEVETKTSCTEQLNLDTGEQIEAVRPNTVFKGKIVFVNMTPPEVGLVFFGLKLNMKKPLLLGKYKYRLPRSGGRPVKFGRVYVEATDKIDFHPLCKAATTTSVPKFVESMIEESKKTYGESFYWDWDEVSKLEELWRQEKQ